MKRFTTALAALSLFVSVASVASAQVVATGPVTSFPPQVQALIAQAGGLGAVVTVSIIGTLAIVTVVNADGSTTTTTTSL